MVFDPSITIEDVKANIPARLKDDEPAPVTLSKEEARERLKRIKEARLVQPQVLYQEPVDNSNNMQPQVLPDDDSWRNKKGVLAQPGRLLGATSGGSGKEVLRYIRSTLEGWEKEKAKHGFAPDDDATARTNHDAIVVIQGWGISEHHIGSLLTTILTECRDRGSPAPRDLTWLADMGKQAVLDMIEGLPA